jgi:hypothetical protein
VIEDVVLNDHVWMRVADQCSPRAIRLDLIEITAVDADRG